MQWAAMSSAFGRPWEAERRRKGSQGPQQGRAIALRNWRKLLLVYSYYLHVLLVQGVRASQAVSQLLCVTHLNAFAKSSFYAHVQVRVCRNAHFAARRAADRRARRPVAETEARDSQLTHV